MGQTIAQKILAAHLRTGEMTVGNDIGIRIDQTLTQDATGTMAYLALERMGITQVRTERSVAYVDHNTLQCGFENADDHRYIASVAAKYGIVYSPAGSGICHQKHLEKFGRPGRTLIGSDSHTPTCGALGMIAIGAGGMDVAVAMAGGAYHISMPKMMKVVVKGRLPDKVTAKDLSLELLRRISVKGGVGYIIEWGGEGIDHLTVPQRATITNMGTELGVTTSVFPSDDETRRFLATFFQRVSVVLFRNLVFDGIQQEVVLVLAEKAAPESGIRVVEVADVREAETVPWACCTTLTVYLAANTGLTDTALAGGQIIHAPPSNINIAAVRRLKPCYHSQNRSFAATRRSEQPN